MKKNKLWIIGLAFASVALTLAGCGSSGGGGGPAPVTLTLGAVSSLYSTNGSAWNDYVKNDGVDIYTASDTACAGTETGGYRACLHGGELRTFTVTGVTSCAGLAAEDALGAFDWVCDDSGGTVRFISAGLRHGKYLSDLIDFGGPGWRDNKVTVRGTGVGETPFSSWWSNPFVVDNNGVTAAEMNGEGTIYLVTADGAAGSYEIGADRVALVIDPGVTLTGPGASADVVVASGRKFLWIEGKVDASGDTRGVYLVTTKFSVLSGAHVENGLYGVWLYSSTNNALSGVTAENNGTHGVELYDSSNNILVGVAAANNGNSGVYLDSSSGNTLSDVTVTNNGYGVVLYTSSNNTVSGVRATNNGYDGIYFNSSVYNELSDVSANNNGYSGVYLFSSSNNNALSGVTATNNYYGVYLYTSSSNIFVDMTAVDNTYGVLFWESANQNTLAGVSAVHNAYGVYVYLSSDNTLSNVTSAHNGNGVVLWDASSNAFSGLLKAGSNNSSNCSVSGGTNPGLDDGTCANNGSSNAALTTDITLASSFVGKVTADDTVNTSDTEGAASYPADPSTFDWVNFENSYRAWGQDGADFLSTGYRWITGAGRIWDWSLLSTDTVIKGVLSVPSGNDTITHTWSGGGVSTFLRHAVELEGNGNGLCESGETCLYTPNIGSYQGHGALMSAGTFADGTLTGITLLKYGLNGR